jgi:hypothetical protein
MLKVWIKELQLNVLRSMKSILILLLFCGFQHLYGQFAVIQDPDGYVNVRKTPSNKSDIIAKAYSGQVIFCYMPEESKDNWYEIYHGEESIKEFGRNWGSGYIYRSRLKYLSEFEIIPAKERSNEKVTFQKDSIKITMTKVPFIPKNNKLRYSPGDEKKHIESILIKINEKKIWGTDGDLPGNQYGQISVEWGNNKFNLPKKSYDDLFEPNLLIGYTHVSFDKSNNRLYIFASNSNAAGSYDVVWIIENRKYIGRVISQGDK